MLFKVLRISLPILLLAGSDLNAQQEPNIRVFIKDSSELSFRADGVIPIFVRGIGEGNLTKKVKSIKLLLKNGEVRFLVNGSLYITSNNLSKVNVRLTSRDSRGIWFGERRYAGELNIYAKGNKLRLVNYLKLEKYLKSVVGAEMPKSWPIESLKAQAVAARTYALKTVKKNNDFDIGSSEKSQVYLGIESETKRINRAVNSTRSMVIVHRGRLIDAVFHSSSGGMTENSSLVWGKHRPYLVSVKDFDQDSPNFNWSITFNSKQLKKAFPEIGGVNAIRVSSRSDSDRVLKALIYGPKGKNFFSGIEIRNRLKMKSTLASFSFESNENNQTPSKDFKLDSDGFPYPPPPPLKGIIWPPNPPSTKNNYYLLLVKGKGSGHGVGLSQWGAHEMAKNGSGYKRILHHYYKGVKITPFLRKYAK